MSLTSTHFTLPPVKEDITPLAVPPRDACRLLAIGQSRLYMLMRSGQLASYQDGRSRRILVAAIHDYIARRIAEASQHEVAGIVDATTPSDAPP